MGSGRRIQKATVEQAQAAEDSLNRVLDTLEYCYARWREAGLDQSESVIEALWELLHPGEANSVLDLLSGQFDEQLSEPGSPFNGLNTLTAIVDRCDAFWRAARTTSILKDIGPPSVRPSSRFFESASGNDDRGPRRE